MNKKLKFTYLFLALLLPGVVFVFLKMFGENEFTIPIYYQSSDLGRGSQCADPPKIPYSVSDKSNVPLGIITVVSFEADASLEIARETSNQLNRMIEAYKDQIEVVSVSFIQAGDKAQTLILDSVTYSNERSCNFLIPKDSSIVLVDSYKRIRGYFIGHSLKDMDRLKTELKILLEDY